MIDDNKTKQYYIVEVFAILLGLFISSAVYICSLDGEYSDRGKLPKIILKSEEPEKFWSLVQADMSKGLILSGVGGLLIFLRKQ